MTGTTCYLKSCVEPLYDVPNHQSTIIVPEYNTYEEQDISPGSCDISDSIVTSEDMCSKLCAGSNNCKGFVLRQEDMRCYLKSCDSPIVASPGHKCFTWKSFHPGPAPQPPALYQKSVRVYPTRTIFELELPGVLAMNVTTLNTKFPDDLVKISMPTTSITLDMRSIDGNSHKVEAYLEVLASHTVDGLDQEVVVNSWNGRNAFGARVGSTAQKIFGVWGDHVNVDWGYLYLGVDARGPGVIYAGADVTDSLHKAFEATGAVPKLKEDSKRPVRPGPYAVAVTYDIGVVSAQKKSITYVYAYDDVDSVYYFGQVQKAYWTTAYPSIVKAIDAMYDDLQADFARSVKYDSQLLADLAAKGGDKYATICALAFHQTFAATKLTWNAAAQKPEMFLKEISTNGDMQTADVVFPSSPLFLYTNANLLQMLLDPLLRFANNETWHPYTDPYSPHQIGVFPVANDTTEAQEEMPMENTGNLFLMMLAILQRNGGDTSFYYPHYFNLLTKWADYLLSTLPFPEDQLCTDDFMGSIANNTNLAAKGIIALNAYAELCYAATHNSRCRSHYGAAAKEFARTWLREALEEDPQPHTTLAYGVPGTWSTKYNLLWQRILKMGDAPFENFDKLAGMEVDWYLAVAKPYGTSLDNRRNWAKIDWLAWAAALANDDASYNAIMDKMYDFLNTSPSRCPLTDLYNVDTGYALGTGSFVARPVVGGFFAKALV